MNCAMGFVYAAAIKTPEVATPSGKTVRYAPAPEGDLTGACWLCGCPTTKGVRKEVAIKSTFTQHNMARVPWSDVACPHCHWGLSYMSLRNYSILATRRGFYHPSRAEVREILLEPPEPPFVLCVAESGQKWLHFRAQLTVARARLRVQFEELAVTVDPAFFAAVLAPIEELYATFTKAELATGEYQSHRIREFGMDRWDRLERAIAPHRRGSLFRLALFVAQREDREGTRDQRDQDNDKGEDSKCITDSTSETRTLL